MIVWSINTIHGAIRKLHMNCEFNMTNMSGIQAQKMANFTPTTHNYYPLGLQLPHFVENESSPISLIARFGVLWIGVIGLSFFFFGYIRPAAKFSDRIAFTWMCLSMYSHCLIHKDSRIQTNILKLALFISFSRLISSFITQHSRAGNLCFPSYGKNIPFQILGT